MSARTPLALTLALALASPAAASAAPAAAPAATLGATRTLVARLARSGRGEAAVTVARSDPIGGPDRIDRGTLALEVPDRVRLDLKGGERIALRGDGGEWLQPRARQLVRIRSEQAGLAAWLWEVFLRGGGTEFREKATGERRFALEPRERETGLPERIAVRLDERGLPAEIAFTEADGAEIRYRFRSWRFMAARGPKAFALQAPRGYEVVDLP